MNRPQPSLAKSTRRAESRAELDGCQDKIQPARFGKSRSPEYGAWRNMISRCQSPKNPRFERYGARGITVCTRWKCFGSFLADMGERPSPKHSLDRIDNDGNYEPANCRWATREQQMRNTSRTIRLPFRGQQITIGEIAEMARLPIHVAHNRFKLGWSAEEIVTRPLSSRAQMARSERTVCARDDAISWDPF